MAAMIDGCQPPDGFGESITASPKVTSARSLDPQEIVVQTAGASAPARTPAQYTRWPMARCLSSTSYRWDRQTNWIDGDYRHTLYDHYMTPNSTSFLTAFAWPMHGCADGSEIRHPRGVNLLFVDGSVHFVKNTINLAAWQAIATVAGGEVISSDSY